MKHFFFLCFKSVQSLPVLTRPVTVSSSHLDLVHSHKFSSPLSMLGFRHRRFLTHTCEHACTLLGFASHLIISPKINMSPNKEETQTRLITLPISHGILKLPRGMLSSVMLILLLKRDLKNKKWGCCT